jgi:hypothetical protein
MNTFHAILFAIITLLSWKLARKSISDFSWYYLLAAVSGLLTGIYTASGLGPLLSQLN